MTQYDVLQTIPGVSDDSSIQANPATGQLPSRDEYGGNHVFEISLPTPGTRERPSWIYAGDLRKVYTKIGQGVPVQFRVKEGYEQGLYVRAVAVYCDTDSFAKPVLRCPVHLQPVSDPANVECNQYLDHIICVKSSSGIQAVYEVDPNSQRRSVCVSLRGPQPGSQWETIIYTFMCLNSCVDGIARRPIAIIFTLERQREVLGRQVLNVRVCAAPKRDFKSEQKQSRLSIENNGEQPVELGPLEQVFHLPVSNQSDMVVLAKYAQEMVQKDYPEGDLKAMELQKYEEVIMRFS